ncbi:phosphodiesterase, MJ0936 family [Desulforamulus reducens MI-1]|uniref:Phosphoesterase n=1 Tax=Desulforamulus reducens (strain ATCC BAA-1160 / DSM 100696 / MI-1) TaxID=349161 RepID=A4J7Y5_DESRM|nr:metallophosphoesterase [Desulforamulus reducens]ABO51188.1 phosphodiesterase, MJ0936 family [Desulforamulus reducens MI-1]
MRILVLADTHGRLGPIYHIMKHIGKVDLILHAGDHYRDCNELAFTLEVPAKGVMGNCDYPGDAPIEDLLEVEGFKIFITHGHRHGVKYGTNSILERAKELGAQVAIYGHTHISDFRVIDNIMIINPGSPVQPRGRKRPSVGLIEIQGNKINTEIFHIDYFYP